MDVIMFGQFRGCRSTGGTRLSASLLSVRRRNPIMKVFVVFLGVSRGKGQRSSGPMPYGLNPSLQV